VVSLSSSATLAAISSVVGAEDLRRLQRPDSVSQSFFPTLFYSWDGIGDDDVMVM
jgi:hypothetical protein